MSIRPRTRAVTGSERSDTLNPKLIPIEGTQVALGGVSRTKVYGLIDDGLLTRVKIGSRAFITSDSIDTYIESLTVKENV